MSDTLLTLAELRAVAEARAEVVRRAEEELFRARRIEAAARKRLERAARRFGVEGFVPLDFDLRGPRGAG